MARTSKRRSGSEKSRVWAGYFFSFLLGVLFTAGGYLFLTHQKVLSPISPSPKRSLSERPASKEFPEPSKKKEVQHRQQIAGQAHRVAIVIDDLGGDNDLFQNLLDLNVPVTFSILPFTPFARSTAQKAFQKGREIILHLPMEPRGYPQVNPGKGALLHSMNKEELLRQLARDIAAVPHARGVSNHMGSRLHGRS